MKSYFLLAALVITVGTIAQNKVDTIRPGDLQMQYLSSGKQDYLVFVEKAGQKMGIWLWERTTRKENWNGVPSIVIRQQWTTSDTGFNSRKLLSVVDPINFLPRYHTTIDPKNGTFAFNMNSTEIVSADSVADSKNKGFKQSLTTATFNWELDLETFPLLPLSEGKTFVVNFYHPGSKQMGPNWYNYTVTGTEKLATLNGEQVDCYKLYTEYANNRGNSTWWLSKKTHEVLKMEEHFGTVTRYKIRLGVIAQ